MFAKECKNFEVRDIKLLQVHQNDPVVTSTAELWNLKLLSSQSVVAVGAALVFESSEALPFYGGD